MKKILSTLLAIFILQSLVLTLTLDQQEVQIKNQIKKIRSEITRLNSLKLATSSKARIAKLVNLVEGHEARIQTMVEQLAQIERKRIQQQRAKEAVIEEPRAVPVEVVPAQAAPVAPQPEETVAEEQPAKRINFEIGALAGIYSAGTGVLGEVRLALPHIWGPATTSLRFAGGLTQSENTDRRYAPVLLDYILNFPAGWFSGVENYLGLGLNYVVMTTGRVAGSYGAQVSYGIESRGFGGMFFGELGYGVLRTGFTPAHRGLSAMVGYRRPWGF